MIWPEESCSPGIFYGPRRCSAKDRTHGCRDECIGIGRSIPEKLAATGGGVGGGGRFIDGCSLAGCGSGVAVGRPAWSVGTGGLLWALCGGDGGHGAGQFIDFGGWGQMGAG